MGQLWTETVVYADDITILLETDAGVGMQVGTQTMFLFAVETHFLSIPHLFVERCRLTCSLMRGACLTVFIWALVPMTQG